MERLEEREGIFFFFSVDFLLLSVAPQPHFFILASWLGPSSSTVYTVQFAVTVHLTLAEPASTQPPEDASASWPTPCFPFQFYSMQLTIL